MGAAEVVELKALPLEKGTPQVAEAPQKPPTQQRIASHFPPPAPSGAHSWGRIGRPDLPAFHMQDRSFVSVHRIRGKIVRRQVLAHRI